MTTYYFSPYPDEYLNGALHRFFKQMSISPWKNVLGRWLRRDVLATPPLDVVERETFPAWGLNWMQIAERYTVIPYNLSFFEHERREKILASFRERLHTIKWGEQKGLRYCEECFAEDRLAGRDEYWRRSHQLPGVFLCHKHGCWLGQTAVSEDLCAVFDPTLRAVGSSRTELAITAQQKEHCVGFACAAYKTVDAPLTYWGPGWQLALNSPDPSLMPRLIEYYGNPFIDRLEALYPIKDWHVGRPLHMQRNVAAPYQVLWGWFQIHDRKETNLCGWPYCINQLADHGPLTVVSRVVKEGRLWKAFCDCGMRFLFRDVRDGIPSVVRIHCHGTFVAVEARRLRAAGRSLVSLAKLYDVNTDTMSRWTKQEREGSRTKAVDE